MDRASVIQGLLSRGVPQHIAQGIAGNIAVESGYDPGINEISPVVPGSRGGFGLFQHTGPRRRALEAYAQSSGKPLADVNTQLDFALQELGTTEKSAADALYKTTNAADAARVFSEKFLRPGIPHLDRRIAAATGGQVSGGAGNQSLLGGLSITPGQGQDTMADSQTGLLGKARQPGGLLGEGGFLSPDRRDRAIIAMQGMTLNPNQAMQQAALAGIQGRAKDRSTKEQRNKTGEFLRQRGREDLAAAVESGAIPAAAAVQEALKGQATQKGVEINGQLVNPVTGELMGDYRDAEGPGVGQVTGSQLIEKFGVEAGTVDPNALFNVKPDGTISRIGGGGTTVNLPGQPQVGTIPAGQQLVKDPETGNFRLENIPGGPAERKQAAEDAASAAVAEKSATNTETRQSVVSEQVDTAMKLLERKGVLDLPEAGIVGGALAGLGLNQEAVDLKNTLATIQGAVAFDTLQKMREASKTGGALGAVSERELDLLTSALGALQQSSSSDLLKKNLATVKRIMGKIESDPVASSYLGSPAAAPASSGGFTIKRRID